MMRLADRWHKSLDEIGAMTCREFRLWMAYLDRKDNR